VPRVPLLNALETETKLYNTDELEFTMARTELCHKVVITP
jgi:hypothetical protein